MSATDPARPAVAFMLDAAFAFTETFLYNQMRSLARYRPLLLCARVEHEERFPWTDPRVRGRRPPRLGRAVRALYGVTPLDRGWRDAIVNTPAVVLHGQFGPNGQIAALYGTQLGLPVVTSFYGVDVSQLLEPCKNARTEWHYVFGKHALFSGSDLVLALSAPMRDDLVRVGCPAAKIRVHPNGVDLERFHPATGARASGPLWVVMCGREVEKKGFIHGFRAVKRARASGVDVRLRWLPAPGPLGASLRASIAALELSPFVEILDPTSEPAAVMRESDVLLCPSVTAADGDKEGVPTVLVEAAASGLPAVASLHSGIPGIVKEGVSGFLYPERDEAGLAAGLVRLANDRALCARMGESARKSIEDSHDARKLAARLEGYYDELRARRRSR